MKKTLAALLCTVAFLSGCGTANKAPVEAPAEQAFVSPTILNISPEDNADTEVGKALAVFVDSRNPSVRQMQDGLLKEDATIDKKGVAEFLSKNNAALALVKAAAQKQYYVENPPNSVDGITFEKAMPRSNAVSLFRTLQIKALTGASLEDARSLVTLGRLRSSQSWSLLQYLMGLEYEGYGLDALQFVMKKSSLSKAELTSIVSFVEKSSDPVQDYIRVQQFEQQIAINELKKLNVYESAQEKLDQYFSEHARFVQQEKCPTIVEQPLPELTDTPGDIALKALLPLETTKNLCKIIAKRSETVTLARSLIR